MSAHRQDLPPSPLGPENRAPAPQTVLIPIGQSGLTGFGVDKFYEKVDEHLAPAIEDEAVATRAENRIGFSVQISNEVGRRIEELKEHDPTFRRRVMFMLAKDRMHRREAAEHAELDAIETHIVAHTVALPNPAYMQAVADRNVPASEFYRPQRDYSHELNPHNIKMLRDILVAKHTNTNSHLPAERTVIERLRSGGILSGHDEEVADYFGIDFASWEAQKAGKAVYIDPAVIEKINYLLKMVSAPNNPKYPVTYNDKFDLLLTNTPEPDDTIARRIEFGRSLREDQIAAYTQANAMNQKKWSAKYDPDDIKDWGWPAVLRYVGGTYRLKYKDESFQDVPFDTMTDLSLAHMLVGKTDMVAELQAKHPELSVAQAKDLAIRQVWKPAVAFRKELQRQHLISRRRGDTGYAVTADAAEFKNQIEHNPLQEDDDIQYCARILDTPSRLEQLDTIVNDQIKDNVRKWHVDREARGLEPLKRLPSDEFAALANDTEASIITRLFGHMVSQDIIDRLHDARYKLHEARKAALAQQQAAARSTAQNTRQAGNHGRPRPKRQSRP